MNIVLRELRAHLRSFLIWAGTMVFLIFAGLMKYSAFQKTGEAVNEIFDSLPAGLQAILGMDAEMDLTSIGVFYSIFFLYFLLLMSVHSTMLGASIIAKEERDKTADFLLVKPIRRSRAVTAKVIAALIMIFLFNQITFLVSAVMVGQYNLTGVSLTGPIFRLMAILSAVQILFLGIGLFLGAFARNAERASGIGTGIILGTFLLKILIEINQDFEGLTFLSPFSYFNAYEIMFDGAIPFGYVVLCIGTAICGIAGTYLVYRKRDLRN